MKKSVDFSDTCMVKCFVNLELTRTGFTSALFSSHFRRGCETKRTSGSQPEMHINQSSLYKAYNGPTKYTIARLTIYTRAVLCIQYCENHTLGTGPKSYHALHYGSPVRSATILLVRNSTSVFFQTTAAMVRVPSLTHATTGYLVYR